MNYVTYFSCIVMGFCAGALWQMKFTQKILDQYQEAVKGWEETLELLKKLDKNI